MYDILLMPYLSIRIFVSSINGIQFTQLVFIQDNDSEDKSTGSSSFANIALGGYGPDLVVDNQGAAVTALMPYQYSMHVDQDTFDNPATVEPDGSSIQLNGNVWRAAPLEQAIEVTSETNLDFDFTLTESVEFHAICLLDASGGAKYDVWNNICVSHQKVGLLIFAYFTGI